MQIPSAAVLASWPKPNYVNPEHTRGPTMLVLTLILAPISFIIVILRTYTRLFISRNFGADDVCIVIAALFTLVCAILSVTAVQHLGWDRHIWDVPPNQLVKGLKYLIGLEICFAAGCTLTKMSLLFFFRRLMSPWSGWPKYITWGLMSICMSELVIFAFVVVFTCQPVQAYWTLSFVPQKCISESAHLLAAGVINTVTDFCVVVLPIPMVLKLRLPRRQQVILALLFGAGFVTVFAGLARVYYTYRLNIADDKTWWAYPLWIAGVVELYLGIIAASIPATKKLVSRYLPKLLGSSFSRSEPSVREAKSAPHRANDQYTIDDVGMWAPEQGEHKSPTSVTPLSLPISSFSNQGQRARESAPSPVSHWKKSHPHTSQSQTDAEITPATDRYIPHANDDTSSVTSDPATTAAVPEKTENRRSSEITEPALVKLSSSESKKSRFSSKSSISSFNVSVPARIKSHLSWEHGRPFVLPKTAPSTEGESEFQKNLDVNLSTRPSGDDNVQPDSEIKLRKSGGG